MFLIVSTSLFPSSFDDSIKMLSFSPFLSTEEFSSDNEQLLTMKFTISVTSFSYSDKLLTKINLWK